METAAKGRANRKALMRDIAREHRKAARKKLADLRQQIRDAKARRRQAITDAKTLCRNKRISARERAKRLRERAKEELRAALRADKDAARSTCTVSLREARALASDVARSSATHRAERAYQAEIRRIERANRQRAQEHPQIGGRVRRQESDDEVRVNIPPEMSMLFERVKRSIRGSDRMSRTEAFFKYAEEHPMEILAAIDDRTEAVIRELEQRERQARRELSRPPREAAPF